MHSPKFYLILFLIFTLFVAAISHVKSRPNGPINVVVGKP
jgi:hypothetical protein